MKKWRVSLALILPVLASMAFASVTPHELASLHAHLAFEYSRAGQHGQALDAAQQAVTLDARHGPAWLARAHALAGLGRDAEAEAAYREALDRMPGDGEACNDYGRFLCDRKRVGEGMALLARALSDPRYASPHLAHLNMGRCSLADGRLDEAEARFLAALETRPAFAPAVRGLAALHLQRGNVRLASFYHGRLLKLTGHAWPEDLLMGVRIARRAGDRVREDEFAARLREHFPDSRETQLLLSGT